MHGTKVTAKFVSTCTAQAGPEEAVFPVILCYLQRALSPVILNLKTAEMDASVATWWPILIQLRLDLWDGWGWGAGFY